MASKSKKDKAILLVSTAGTGTTYITTRTGEEKLALKKYDKKIRKHVLFKEKKKS